MVASVIAMIADGRMAMNAGGENRPPSGRSSVMPASCCELVPDRQPPNPLAGCSEDRVAQCRCERRYARLANAARRHVDSVLDDVCARLRWRLVDADELEVVEIALL